MTDFYLITGFLGAGKTTLIHSLLSVFKDKQVCLIINEFGKVGIDTKLFADTNTTLQEIVSGSIFCVCRLDQFESALENALVKTPDVIIVEASGLSDPTAIRRILNKHINDERLVYRGAICLADAPRYMKIIQTVRVCKKQFAISDLIIVNKTDLVTQDELSTVLEQIKLQFPYAAVETTQYGAITRDILDSLKCGEHISKEIDERPNITKQRATVDVSLKMDSTQLEKFVKMVAEDTQRIKGFVQLSDGIFYVDCVGPYVKITRWAGEIPAENKLVILATEGMQLRKALKTAQKWYPDHISLELS